jgi:integrase
LCGVLVKVYDAFMASIKQYRGKTWRAIIRRKGFPTQSKTFEFKKDAEVWAASIEGKMGVKFSQLQLDVAKTQTVKDVFDRYAKEVAVHMKGKTEVDTVNRIARDAKFAKLLLSRITPQDIRIWRDDRVKEVQPQTVNREFATISSVFAHAIEEWIAPLESNPCKGVSRFKGADKPRDTLWSQSDTKTLLDAIGWSETKPLLTGRDYVGWALLLGIETAMRIGELCLLTVADFHPEEQYAFLSDTKNGDSRKVPLSTTAIRYLTILCKDKKPADKIIPINANTLGEYFLDARRLCGLEHIVFHDSRRTAVTNMSKKLSNVLELAAVTGHRSLKILHRTYYSPTASDIAKKLG